MRAKLTILLFLCSFSALFAQIGVQAHWENLTRTGENSAQFNGYTIGMDYWFRLEKVRLEFHPMLGYQNLSQQFENSEESTVYSSLVFELQTNFYPLDWFNDCKCPTFGKTNEFIKKGFFLSLAPIIGKNISESKSSDSNEWMYGVKAGAGLDIGVAQFLTITPIARLALLPRHYLGNPEFQSSTVFGYNLGVTATFRFDKKNYAFR